jgi:YegS/Rv2252/BmrU family lipid kinase
MRRVQLIVNPCAGRGAGAELAPRIVAELRADGVDAEMRLTKGPRHAIELVEGAVRGGADQIVIAGGDGTIFEAVNGMMRGGAERATLGIVPVGTGNDFVKMLGLSDWRVACARIGAGAARAVDVGRCGELYFANGVGVGFDAQVAMRANRINWLSGTPVYAVALLEVLALDYRRPLLRIHHDGGTCEQRITLVAIANGRCYGGAFHVAPGAALDDGLLELVIAEGLSRTRVLGLVPRVLRGTHLGHPAVTALRSRRVRIESDEPVVVHADGEILDASARSIDVELLPQALRVFA